MSVRVYIDGEVHTEASARISVFDRGFLYGDSVYEVMRTAGGRPVDIERHLGRLEQSAAGLVLDLPPAGELQGAIETTLAAAGNAESYVRIVVTRGRGEIGLDPALAVGGSTVVIVKPLELPPPELYQRGATLALVEVQRTSRRSVDPSLKSGNYLNNILALAEARRSGAYEAVMCDAQGRVAEGSSSNLFIVCGGRLSTPALDVGLLAGITRGRVLELAGEVGIDAREGDLRPADVRAADEVFITSSIRGVLPIARVDQTAIGPVCPGPVTRSISERYGRFLAAVAAGEKSPARAS